MTSARTPKPLACSIGEPGGIGPDLLLTAYRDRHSEKLPPFYIIGDPEMLASRARRLGWNLPIRIARPEQAAALFLEALPVATPAA